MTVTDDLVEMLATMAGFSIDPAHRPGVAANLALLLDRAALIATPPLAVVAEPAPVFHP
ncbi:MAG TPA: AtzG-like protein [Sphingomonas sp.]